VGALSKVLRSRISDAYCPHLSPFLRLPSGCGAPVQAQGHCSERTTLMLQLQSNGPEDLPREKSRLWECTTALRKETTSIWNRTSVSSVTQSYPTLCDPMDCSRPGLPVHHQLPEFTHTHVYWVSDAIQPSHPLSCPVRYLTSPF